MKLTAFLLLVACLQVGATGYSQITLSVKNAPLSKVFDEISRQSGYEFLYTTEALKNAKAVDVKLDNATLQEALDICFNGQPVTFTIIEKTVVVKEKPTPAGDLQSAAPPIDITGKVTDTDNKPLEGATIKVKGTNNITITNKEGTFSLSSLEEKAVLEISFIGFETQRLTVKSKTLISVHMKKNESPLDDVQVQAYGTTSKRFSVGNITTVKGEDIARQPVSNPLLALEGRVPGLFIVQNSGVPGGGVSVQIQGKNSISNGNYPFYVIDGVPFYSSLPTAGYDDVLGSSGGTGNVANGNPMNYINPLDIASIEVLKDADATAIYGSRAANGAILITTKKGKAGSTKVDINVEQGSGIVTKYMKMLNRRQYLDMRYEAYKNDGVDITTLTPGGDNYDLTVWDTTRSTDWQKMFIGGTAHYTSINASISGGTNAIQYLIGGTYQKETTVFPGDFSNQKATLHFNINSASVNQRFRTQFTGSFMLNHNSLPGTDLTSQANLLEPVAPALYNEDGTVNWAVGPAGNSTWDNPLASVLYKKFRDQTNSLTSNLQLSYILGRGLELKSSFGFNFLQSTQFTGYPLQFFKPEDLPYVSRAATYGNRLMTSWIVDPQLVYKCTSWAGKLEGLLGISIQQSKANSGSIEGRGYSSDELLEDFKAAASIKAGNSTIAQQKYCALFGRLNYNLYDKYIVNLNARRDGSSRFGANNQFHNFWSIGGAWLFSKEALFQKNVSIFSFGKIRASYGTTGSDQIADYQFLNLYYSFNTGVPYQGLVGLSPTGLPNPYLQWEETKKQQFGIDLGFLRDEILLSATYSRNRTSNQLLAYELPFITGNSSISKNFPATVENTSLEFSVNTINIKNKKFVWTSTFNLTIPRNKLIAFPDIENSTYNSTLVIGQPISVNYSYHFLGVNQATGVYQVSDREGHSTSNPDYEKDRTMFLNNLPKYYGGWSNHFEYKGFDVELFLQVVSQKSFNRYYNNGTFIAPGSFYSGFSNQPVTVLDRWKQVGDIANIQRYSSDFTSPISSLLYLASGSDAGLTSGTYFRLKNVSIGWQFPLKWQQKAHLKDARIFMNAQNLLTISGYKGMDPESQNYQSLPPLKMLTIGLKVSL